MHFSSTTLSPRQIAVNRNLWIFAGILLAINTALMMWVGMYLRFGDRNIILVILGIALITGRYVWKSDALAIAAHIIGQIILAGLILTMSSYLGARLTLPLIDHTLITIDAHLGFDWRNFMLWFYGLDTHALIAPILGFAYYSLELQMTILVFLLCFCQQSAHAQRMVILIYITGIITIIISTIFPSTMPYVYYDGSLPNFDQIHPLAARINDELAGMRNHTSSVIAFPSDGLVTFPSFHTIMAIILIYACLPLRYIRMPVIVLNIIMLIATLCNGGHYLIDILAGFIIAAIGIYVARTILPPEQPLLNRQPSEQK